MAKKEVCRRRKKISERIRTGSISCFRGGVTRLVPVEVTPDGNRCIRKECPYSGKLIEQVLD